MFLAKRLPFSVQYKDLAVISSSALTVHTAVKLEPMRSTGSWGDMTAKSGGQNKRRLHDSSNFYNWIYDRQLERLHKVSFQHLKWFSIL